jgi:aminopeptidase N
MMLRRYVAIAIAFASLFIAAAPAAAQPRFDFKATPGRLAKDVVPSLYRLHFVLDPAQPEFQGRASIELRLARPRGELLLHAHGLVAGSAEIEDARGRKVALEVQPQAETQTWRLRADRPLPAGRYRLSLSWTGRVNASGEGLFRAGPRAAPILATQFQAVHARAVFPAFDEPAFRARFEITASAPRGLQVLSNMPRVERRDDGAARELHRFALTPPMPSYLVALAVGRFDVLEGRAGTVPLAIYTAPGKQALGAYALASTQQLLPHFERYFGQPYALPKLDQIAVPSTRTGAMEDWGLISYIENALLFDPEKGSPQQQRRIFSIIAHEVGHQWFGNLVTAASWNEIWLNEAFATWLAEKAEHHFNPQWQVPISRRLRLERVLSRDAGQATRPIRGGDVPEARVFDVFDSITYDKGGAVLTMLEQWAGEDAFQRGLQAYMAARRMSNATAGDLWFHLGRAARRDVHAVARQWTDRTGYPLIHADESCVDGRSVMDLRQEPFRIDAAPAPASDAAPPWPVPMRLQRGEAQRTVMFDRAAARVDLGACADLPWIVNAGGAGFYRVSYGPDSRRALLARFERLAPADRVTLFSDVLALVQAGRQDVAVWLDLAARIATIDDDGRASLVRQMADGFGWLRRAVGPGPLDEALTQRARALLGAEWRRVGWQPRAGESWEQAQLRTVLIGELAELNDPDILAEAGALFDRERRGEGAVTGAVRSAVVRAAGRSADAARFDAMLAMLDQTTSYAERRDLLEALASARDETLALRALALALSDRLSPELATGIAGVVARHPVIGERAYAFTVEHFAVLSRHASSGPFGGRAWLLPSATAGLAKREDAARLLADQQRLAGPDAMVAARQIAEQIERRAAWRERHAASVQAALTAVR